ncbi:MAG: relaxase domain-containing protein [Propionibacteriaceae bacterium]|nr:relaxase domain-containing protein [Propionibacteriaceae bacterium]
MLSLHKLTAGTGYDYLTRQVAAMDSTEKGHTSLADYYDQKGESPGHWVGSGLVGIDGVVAGDVVTADQMLSLFGLGDHPLATERLAALDLRATDRDIKDAMQLGQRYGVYPGMTEFSVELTKRIGDWNLAHGRDPGAPVPAEVRAEFRTEVGREHFRTRFGREPMDARELSGFIVRSSRPVRSGVAGYDATFSPVKSVSALWALADPEISAAVERCHDQAVADSLRFMEELAIYTRRGRNGVRQVKTHGIVAASFTHRDSRAGDPDLHTHVAIANKVQAADDGAWLTIDGRIMFKANVTVSEFYNTALEKHLTRELGVRFVNRPGCDPERPVRELEGVDLALLERWSQRDKLITRRQGGLVADFQKRHGRTPTSTELHNLAQQATLQTREAKHEPRSLAEQRRVWAIQAEQVLGRGGTSHMLARVLRPRVRPVRVVDERRLQALAANVVSVVQRHRSWWQPWHVRAEALRQVRIAGVPELASALDRVVDLSLERFSVRLTPAGDGITEPAALRRPDGSSVYTVADSAIYTSQQILDAESRLVALAGRRDGMVVGERSISLALLATLANGVQLNPGQVDLVRRMASSGERLQLAIAPAGAGKTTAISTLGAAWREAGGEVFGMAPSATAAAALAEQLGGHADTLHILTQGLSTGRLPAWARQIGPRSLVVIDEAGMADTLTLEAAVSFVVSRGGSVRLVGDDHQLAAVEAGGVLRDLDAEHGAVRLTEVVRFADPVEASASLALREGRPDALGFYLDQGRVHVGDAGSTLDQAFAAWASDRASGLDSLMLAPTRELVSELNQRARASRLGGVAADREVALADGNRASVGDIVVTRRNERRLRFSPTGWVRNGDRWTVTGVGHDLSLTVANGRGFQITLPAEYVRADVELGYATTIHGAQGATVDTMHGVLTGAESRQQLYTMMTRGRLTNHAYVQVVGDGDPDSIVRLETAMPPTPTEVLESVLARDEAALSAIGLRRAEADPATQLKPAVDRYVDALGVAAEQIVGPERAASLEAQAEQVVPELTNSPAWPVLKSQLMLLAASGANAISVLETAVRDGGLDDARDPAAVLSWRLDRAERGGPLPWVSGIPTRLAEDPQWGPYLSSRSELVRDLATKVREASGTREHRWQEGLHDDLTAELVAHVTVWRAAMGVPEGDLRPTGSAQPPSAASRWQNVLEDHLELANPELQHWKAMVRQLAPQLRSDPQTPVLAAKLASLASAGEDVQRRLSLALRRGPLPDDHAASALLYRLERPRQEPIREMWETVEHTESMGQRHERMRPPDLGPSHGHGIGI